MVNTRSNDEQPLLLRSVAPSVVDGAKTVQKYCHVCFYSEVLLLLLQHQWVHPPPTPTAPDDNMYQTSIHNRIHLLFVFQSSWDLLQTVSLRLLIFLTYRLWTSETVSVLVVSAGSEQAVSLSLVPPSVSWRAQCFWASRRRKKNSF